MTLFEYDNYKAYVLGILKKMPNAGYGQFRKIAKHLQVNSVIVSQVFKGDRQLSPEQGLDLAEYFGLSDLESSYFVLLIQIERAGNSRLKNHLQKRLLELKKKSSELKNILPQDKILTEEAKATFYSHWYYSGVRLLSSVKNFDSVDAIAEHLHLPRATAKRVADFLVAQGLCVEERGKLKMGPKVTHLEATSPLVSRHHTNWRLRALQNLEPLSKDELFYSGPMALSNEDALWVRSRLVELIENVVQRVKVSESERLACLNIDWFDFRGRPE
ncbi:MAG: TIGR02147 family protein [Bdellovibrionales bacterium]|nr:TIGR02147 family protein [Bdellovibrionales bacterium]